MSSSTTSSSFAAAAGQRQQQQQQQQRRQPPKQASAEALRRRMTERRHQRMHQIRKVKKTELLARKRRYHGHHGTQQQQQQQQGQGEIMMEDIMEEEEEQVLQPSQDTQQPQQPQQHLTDLAWAFLRSPTSVERLSALQTALSAPNSSNNINENTRDVASLPLLQTPQQTMEEDQHAERNSSTNPSLQLMNALAHCLTTTTSTTLEEMPLLAARVLTNLAATPATFGNTTSSASTTTSIADNDDDSYYQPPQEGWCDVLIASQALFALLHVLSSSSCDDTNIHDVQQKNVELRQQCCWAVGNILGDAAGREQVLRRCGGDGSSALLEALALNLQAGLLLHQQPHLCRNAAWALSNLTRDGAGRMNVPVTMTELRQSRLFQNDSRLIVQVLQCPLVVNTTATKQSNTTSASVLLWWEVAMEMAWVLAFLTARRDDNDETVEALLSSSGSDGGGTKNAVCEALIRLLGCAIENVVVVVRNNNSNNFSMQEENSSNNNDAGIPGIPLELALRVCLPCLRTVGNLATASQGRHVPSLLLCNHHHYNLSAALAALLEATMKVHTHQTTTMSTVVAVATEAAWTAGTLLCDAGLPGHPSTTVACPTLLPALCRCVVAVKNNTARWELRRESILALWNAVAAPPTEMEEKEDARRSTTRPVRDEFLKQLVSFGGMVAALTEWLSSSDMDAVLAAVHLLDAILRRLQQHDEMVRREFLEAQGVEALEAVCDRASQNVSYGAGQEWQKGGGGGVLVSDECADIAADLIDDLFSEEYEETMMASSSLEQHQAAGQATFSFHVSSSSSSQTAAFDFGAPSSQQPPAAFPPSPSNSGVGRGRGKPVPSWMNQTTGNS